MKQRFHAKRLSRWRRGYLALAVAVLALTAVGCGTNVGSADGWAGPASIPGGLVLVQERSGQPVALDLSGDVARVAWRYPDDVPLPSSIKDDDVDLKALYAAPIVDGDTLYLAGYSGVVVALDLSEELPALIWTAKVADAVIGTPAFDAGEGMLYVPTEGGDLIPIATAGGDVGATLVRGGERFWSRVSLEGGALYVAGLDRHVRAVSPSSGDELWSVELGGGVPGDPLVADGTVYAGALDRTMYALDAQAGGSERWDARGDGWFWAEPLLAGDTLYAATARGSVYAFDAASGTERWRFHEDSSEIRAKPVLVGGILVIASREGLLWGVDPDTGEARWSGEVIDERLLSDPLVLESILLFASEDGTLIKLDPLTGETSTVFERS